MVRAAASSLLAISCAVGLCLCQDQGSSRRFPGGIGRPPVVHRPAASHAPAGGSVVSVFDLVAPKPAVKAMEQGVEAWDTGQLAQAEQAFKSAILLYPSFSSAYNNLGVVFLREGRRDDAEWALRQALRIDNRSPRALLNLANALFEDRHWAEAEPLLNRLLAIEPLNPQALLLLSRIDFALARFDSVVSAARRAHSCHKHDGYIHFVSARALEHKGLKREALSEYLTFLEESPRGGQAGIAADRVEAIRKDANTK
jgi:hypothetical protein